MLAAPAEPVAAVEAEFGVGRQFRATGGADLCQLCAAVKTELRPVGVGRSTVRAVGHPTHSFIACSSSTYRGAILRIAGQSWRDSPNRRPVRSAILENRATLDAL